MKNDKKGISLIILVVTIIIMVIIGGAGIVLTNNMIDNSKKATFTDDLKNIQDMVKEYYINTGALPIAKNGTEDIVFTKQQFIDAQSENNKNVLQDEVIFNKDNEDTNKFYKIDLQKIGVESISRGADTTPEATDIYVVSEDTMTVYYFEGYKINDLVYYSLTDKLIEIEKIESEVEEYSTITITELSDISVEKSTELKTNTINITISGNIQEGESIQYKIAGQEGYTTISQLPVTITVTPAIFTSADMIETFNNSKEMYVEKVGTTQNILVDLSNLDIEGPIVTSYTVDKTAENFNVLNIEGTDIKYIYYEYLTKIENDSEIPYYESIPAITIDYLKTFGKKTEQVVLDKSIKSICMIMVDDAGNTTEIYTLDNLNGN